MEHHQKMLCAIEDMNEAQNRGFLEFERRGHVIIYGPRQSGKTSVLQRIVSSAPEDHKVLVVGLLGVISNHYGNFPNATLVTPSRFIEMHTKYKHGVHDDDSTGDLRNYNMIVADGGIIYPLDDFQTASAYCDDECLLVIGKPHTAKFHSLSGDPATRSR